MIQKILKHPLLRSSLIYVITDSINKAVPFFILPVLSHYLLPGDYGIVADFGVLSGIIAILISLNIDGAIAVNYHKLDKTCISRYVFNAFLVCFASFCILFFLSFFLKDWIFSLLHIPFEYQLLCIFMCFMSLFTTTNLVLWRLEERPWAFGIYEITNTVLNLGLSIVLVVILKQNWVGRVNAMLITTIGYGLFSFLLIIKRKYIQFKVDKAFLKDILFFGIPLIPHSLSFWVRSGVDRIFITKFWGIDQVGLYATGFVFGAFVSFLIGAFNNAYSPFLFRTLSNTDENQLKESKKKMVKMTYGIMVCLVLCGIFFIILSNIILKYWFSKEYVGASSYIYWAIASQVFQSFYILFVNYIFFAKKTGQLATITFSASVIHVILSYIMVKNIGPIGAAYSNTIVAFLTFITVMIYSMKAYEMPWFKSIKQTKA